ncbi:endoribonuclease YbeY [Candidatus Mycoplasma haematohominis]|uniref:Endoribonuclease YbeY n=1 Tax=Candidatus Mycoplasma haematohominis TaxID=1494318 RepID=A0A478FPK6_9MOLU|nr:rRNA maturation RNase YbeY [Candidatus Mycoplasma haemohominis]GCE63321.1 endoribonuclease YbeY [Candidatus Mycoplasma haemohominis]
MDNYLERIFLIFLNRFNLINRKLFVEIGIFEADVIRKLNKRYRGKDLETDVLSFPMEPQSGEKLLGAVYFCYSIIENKYEDVLFGFCFLFAHSLLHLIGYEHNEEMFSIQDEIIREVFE